MQTPKPMGCSKSGYKRKGDSGKYLCQEIRKSQINNLNLYLKELKKEEPMKSKCHRKENNIA